MILRSSISNTCNCMMAGVSMQWALEGREAYWGSLSLSFPYARMMIRAFLDWLRATTVGGSSEWAPKTSSYKNVVVFVWFKI